jgi:hypothetical protein
MCLIEIVYFQKHCYSMRKKDRIVCKTDSNVSGNRSGGKAEDRERRVVQIK